MWNGYQGYQTVFIIQLLSVLNRHSGNISKRSHHHQFFFHERGEKSTGYDDSNTVSRRAVTRGGGEEMFSEEGRWLLISLDSRRKRQRGICDLRGNSCNCFLWRKTWAQCTTYNTRQRFDFFPPKYVFRSINNVIRPTSTTYKHTLPRRDRHCREHTGDCRISV